MRKRPTSLLKTLFKSLLVPGIVAAILGVFIVYSLVKEEYDELQDVTLLSKAHLLLQVFNAQGQAVNDPAETAPLNPLSFEPEFLDAEELTVFWLLDGAGQVISHSPLAERSVLQMRVEDGLVTAGGYRIAAITAPDGGGSVVLATPMGERNETIMDVLIGVIVSFALLGGFVAFAAYRAVGRSAAVIADLSAEIETKDAYDLSPIDRKNSFAEIEPALDTVDTLMERLDAALQAERAFATNAAHELRTPVAICVAHVQRLRTKLSDPDAVGSAAEIEQALKRLTRLIERLLQMSRAQSGLGVSAVKADIVPVVNLLLREMRARVPSPEMLVLTPPQGVWMSDVDPDAIGIVLNNLFDNALRHGSGDAPIVVDASQRGRIIVSNDCAALEPADLGAIKQRFARSATRSEGFGLGLSIVQELCIQSGSVLELSSPQNGKMRGFSAAVAFSLSK